MEISSGNWYKKVREDLALLAEHERKLEAAWKAYEMVRESSPGIEENKSLRVAAKHSLQACTELLRAEILMIGRISPKIAIELETDLNKWLRKAVKEIEDKGPYEENDSVRIVDIRSKVKLVQRVIHDMIDSLEGSANNYK